MKIKRLLSLVLATVAAAGVFVLSACGNGSVAGKTYTFYSVEVDSSQYEETGDTPPTEEDIAALEERYSTCYFSFGEDSTFTAIFPQNSVNTSVEQYYYYETVEEGVECVALCFTQENVEAGTSFRNLYKVNGKLCYEMVYETFVSIEQSTVDGVEVLMEVTHIYCCTIYFAA